jgi:hypothetical protein
MVDARVAGSSFPFHAQDHRLVDARRPQERAGARRARHGRCRAAAGRALRSRHAVHTPRLRRLRQAIRHPPLDGAIGDPRHNALAETFFASREKELLRRERFATREHARRRIFWYIECFYNTRRRQQPRRHQPSRLRTAILRKQGRRGLRPRCQPKRVNSKGTPRRVAAPRRNGALGRMRPPLRTAPPARSRRGRSAHPEHQ